MSVLNTYLLIGLRLITHDASVFDILAYLENLKQMLQYIFVNKFEQFWRHIMYIKLKDPASLILWPQWTLLFNPDCVLAVMYENNRCYIATNVFTF